MDREITDLLTAFVEKVGLLRTDMTKKGDLAKYEARMVRIDQKLTALAERVGRDDRDAASRLQSVWNQPGRSLAFRNRDHQQEIKEEGGRRKEKE
jgi:hypothetical protein